MAWSKKKGVQLENRADAENLWDFVDSQSPQSSTEGHSWVLRAAQLQPTLGWTQGSLHLPNPLPQPWAPPPSTGECVVILDTSQAAESWHFCSSCSKQAGAAAKWGSSHRLSPGEAVVALTEGPCAGSLLHQHFFQEQPKAAEHQPPQRSEWDSRVRPWCWGCVCPHAPSASKVPLHGPGMAPPPLHLCRGATGCSTSICTSCGHARGHTVSLSCVLATGISAQTQGLVHHVPEQPRGRRASLFRTLMTQIKPLPSQLPVIGTIQMG